jgi:hypothetical protein
MSSHNELNPILEKMILVLFLVENDLSVIQVWTSQNHPANVEWNNTQLYLINEIGCDLKP